MPQLNNGVSQLRTAVQNWLRAQYDLLRNNGVIADWLREYPEIAIRIEAAGSSKKSATREEWNFFGNGYTLNGYRPLDTQQRMRHIGLDAPMSFAPFGDKTLGTAVLVLRHSLGTLLYTSLETFPIHAAADLRQCDSRARSG